MPLSSRVNVIGPTKRPTGYVSAHRTLAHEGALEWVCNGNGNGGGGEGGFHFKQKGKESPWVGRPPRGPYNSPYLGQTNNASGRKGYAKAIGCADSHRNPRLARTDMLIVDWKKIFAGYNAKTNQGLWMRRFVLCNWSTAWKDGSTSSSMATDLFSFFFFFLFFSYSFSSSSSCSSCCFDVALLLVPIFCGCSLKVGNERKHCERGSRVDCVIAMAVVGLAWTPFS